MRSTPTAVLQSLSLIDHALPITQHAVRVQIRLSRRHVAVTGDYKRGRVSDGWSQETYQEARDEGPRHS